MPRRPGDVQIQMVASPEMRRAISIAVLKLEPMVPTEKAMDRGMMLNFLMRWFLSRSEGEQAEILREGKGLLDGVSSPAPQPRKKSVRRGARNPLPTAPAKGGKVEPGREHEAVFGPKDAKPVKK